MKPSIGRIVHFVEVPTSDYKPGTHRPAIVIEVYGDADEQCLLAVFGRADGGPQPQVSRHAEDGTPGTWHWPERIGEARAPSFLQSAQEATAVGRTIPRTDDTPAPSVPRREPERA